MLDRLSGMVATGSALAAFVCALVIAAPLPAQTAGPQTVEFNRDVRPILLDNCFACHGPDKAKRKADLRLDTADGGKAAVVPGKPEQSELIKRVTSDDPETLMPPPKTGHRLTASQISTLKEWIQQ